MKHVTRLGSGNAFTDVKTVGDHKDRENRDLGGNQAIHRHRAAGWETPAEFIFLDGYGLCAHDVTRNASQDLPGASGPTVGGGS